jgi:hypothetical protein
LRYIDNNIVDGIFVDNLILNEPGKLSERLTSLVGRFTI